MSETTRYLEKNTMLIRKATEEEMLDKLGYDIQITYVKKETN